MSDQIDAPERYRTVSGYPLSAGFLKSAFDVRAAAAATLATAFNVAVFTPHLMSRESLVIAGAGAVGYGMARAANAVYLLLHSAQLRGNKAAAAKSEEGLKSFRHVAKGVCFDTQNQPTATRGEDRVVSGLWAVSSGVVGGVAAIGAVVIPIVAFYERSKGLPVDETLMQQTMTLPFLVAGATGFIAHAHGALKVATGKWSVVQKPPRAETTNVPPSLS
jgi:hypothetical protein